LKVKFLFIAIKFPPQENTYGRTKTPNANASAKTSTEGLFDAKLSSSIEYQGSLSSNQLV
jgi:hypothetical protein